MDGEARPEATRRWTAAPDSARGATRAVMRHGFSRRAFWLVAVTAWAIAAGLLAWSIDDRWSVVVRILAGGVYAALIVVPFLAGALALAYAANLRNARRRLAPGAGFEATATDADVTMSGPLGVTVTVPHDAWSMVRVSGDWVLTRQVGLPVVSVWPRALFSDETLARMTARR